MVKIAFIYSDTRIIRYDHLKSLINSSDNSENNNTYNDITVYSENSVI